MKQTLTKSILFFTNLILFMGCSPKDNGTVDSSLSRVKAKISLRDVSSGNCMNLEKLMSFMQDLRFIYPAEIMITDLKAMVPLSESQLEYFSFASFALKSAKGNQLGLFSQVQQSDCQTIRIHSTSDDILTFTIVESSDRHLKFKLVDSFGEDIPPDLRKSLYERNQPYEYTFDMTSETSFICTEKYRTVNLLCEASPPADFTITKNVAWGELDSELPDHFQIEPNYLAKVLAAINGTPAETTEPGILTLKQIQDIMATPIRSDIQICR